MAKISVVSLNSLENCESKIEGTFDGSTHLRALNKRQRSILRSVPSSEETMILLKCADAIDTLLVMGNGRLVEEYGGVAIFDGRAAILVMKNTANPGDTCILIDLAEMSGKRHILYSQACYSQRVRVSTLGSLLLICTILLSYRRMS